VVDVSLDPSGPVSSLESLGDSVVASTLVDGDMEDVDPEVSSAAPVEDPSLLSGTLSEHATRRKEANNDEVR
jgi:hypothetical protein